MSHETVTVIKRFPTLINWCTFYHVRMSFHISKTDWYKNAYGTLCS